MRFTDRKTHFTDRIPLLSIHSICTDRHMAYTDRYSAGVLDNPHLNEVLKTMFAGSTFPSLPSPHSSQSLSLEPAGTGITNLQTGVLV